jgi:pyruvate dehydrogenase E2 component (dihydrolipoamide acetyltransferase)
MSNTKTIEIRVPDIGDFAGVPVIEVLVASGDSVVEEQSLVTLESDKATMEVPSPGAGVIRDLKLKVGDEVSQGDLVALLELSETADAGAEGKESPPAEPEQQQSPPAESETAKPAAGPVQGEQPGSKPEPAPDARPAASAPVASAGPVEINSPPGSLPYASPSVRRYSRELGVDLGSVKGTGKGGRILADDVTAFVKAMMSGQARPSSAAAAGSGFAGFNLPPAPKVDFSRYGEVSIEPRSRIQKISAGHLHRNWVSIPHVTQHDEADITDMENFRKAHTAEAEKRGFKLTPLVFLIKASVAALKKFPQFNSSLDESGENLILKSFFNIGIAVDTPQGLVVPVLRDCERKGIMELASELSELSAVARDQKLKPQDIQGGCFSISSLGGIGGTAFTPIINAPEVAILGVSRSSLKPVWDGKAFQPKLMLPLSVSYDHRVIDGAMAARFTRFLASQLEDLRRLTL